MADLNTGIAELLGIRSPATAQNYENNTNVIQQGRIQTQSQQLQLAAAIQQAKIAAANRQQAQQDLVDYRNSDPTSPDYTNLYNKLLLSNPELKDQAKQGFDALSADEQKQSMQDMLSFNGYIDPSQDKPDIASARALLQQTRAADVAAGKSTDHDDSALAALDGYDKTGNKAILNNLYNTGVLQLGLLADPSKFADAYPNLAKVPTDIASTEATTASTNATANKTGIEASQLVPAQAAHEQAQADDLNRGKLDYASNPNGDPIPYNTNPNAPQPQLTQDASVSAQSIANGYAGLQTTENNTGNPSAKNPLSSATGNGQFINSTWLDQIKTNYPELAKGKSDAAILALRNDPQLSNQVGQDYYKQNAYDLYNQGLPVNTATAAMAYKVGPDNAKNILKNIQNGNGDASLASVLSPKELTANPQLRPNGKPLSLNGYYQSLAQNPNIGENPIALADPSSTGSLYLNSLPRGKSEVVKKIINGELPAPVGRAGLADDKDLMQSVIKADPTFKSTRFQALNDMNDGTKPQGAALINLKTMSKHYAKLADLAYQLNQVSAPIGNAIGNGLSDLTGGKRATLVNEFKHEVNTAAQEQQQFYGKETIPADESIKKIFDPSKKSSDLIIAAKQGLDNAYDRVGSYNSSFRQQAGMDIPYDRLLDQGAINAKAKVDYYSDLVDKKSNNMRQPNHNAISLLYSNPSPTAINQFNAVYGPGTAQEYLKNKMLGFAATSNPGSGS